MSQREHLSDGIALVQPGVALGNLKAVVGQRVPRHEEGSDLDLAMPTDREDRGCFVVDRETPLLAEGVQPQQRLPEVRRRRPHWSVIARQSGLGDGVDQRLGQRGSGVVVTAGWLVMQ